MNWLSKEMKDTSFHIISQKDQQFKIKLTFDDPKIKFQNGLKQQTSNFWAFLILTDLWEPKPPNNFSSILADSESCEQFRDFGTWGGR